MNQPSVASMYTYSTRLFLLPEKTFRKTNIISLRSRTNFFCSCKNYAITFLHDDVIGVDSFVLNMEMNIKSYLKLTTNSVFVMCLSKKYVSLKLCRFLVSIKTTEMFQRDDNKTRNNQNTRKSWLRFQPFLVC